MGSWIGIRILKSKFRSFRGSKWSHGRSELVVAESHRFGEERDPDPDPVLKLKEGPGPQSKRCGSATLEDNKLLSNVDWKTKMKLFSDGDFS